TECDLRPLRSGPSGLSSIRRWISRSQMFTQRCRRIRWNREMQDAGPAYWLDLFTGKTWDEFRAAGAAITGFRQGSASVCKRIRPGDILVCYVTGVKRWVGGLEVVGPSGDTSRIWTDDAFPVRIAVRPLVLLDAVY